MAHVHSYDESRHNNVTFYLFVCLFVCLFLQSVLTISGISHANKFYHFD